VHASPGKHQTFDISPKHLGSQSRSRSSSTGDETAETESIDTFSHAVNKPQLPMCAPNMSLSLNQAELDQVLDDLTSQSPLPAALIDTVEPSTPLSDYNTADRCPIVESFRAERDQPVNELAGGNEIASRRESSSSPQVQELSLNDNGLLISGQIQSPALGSAQHIGERGLADETPEQQSESARSHIASTGGQMTEIENVDTFSQADKQSPLQVHPPDTNLSLGQAEPHRDLDLSSPGFPQYALIDTIESSALQSDHAVASACSTAEASEERTDQSELRLTSSGESENGCASDVKAQTEELFSTDVSLSPSTSDQEPPPLASVEEANISCQEGPEEETLEQQFQLDANSEDDDSTADTCNRQAETQSGELEEQEVDEQSQDERRVLRPRNPSFAAMHSPGKELQQVKRKPSKHMSREGSRKKLKTLSQSDNIRPASLKELERIPQDIIQPSEVCQKLLTRCGNVDEGSLWLFARLFYAVASPDAFSQLRDACALVREGGEYTISQQTDTVGQTIKALDGLETAASTHAILRRYHLARLVEHRNDKEDNIAQQGRRSIRAKSKDTPLEGSGHKDEQIEGYGRISSMALSSLMAEAYPELERPSRMQNASPEYKKRHKSLQNMLSAGRNWHLMQLHFSPGILALIPTGGETGVQNYE